MSREDRTKAEETTSRATGAQAVVTPADAGSTSSAPAPPLAAGARAAHHLPPPAPGTCRSARLARLLAHFATRTAARSSDHPTLRTSHGCLSPSATSRAHMEYAYVEYVFQHVGSQGIGMKIPGEACSAALRAIAKRAVRSVDCWTGAPRVVCATRCLRADMSLLTLCADGCTPVLSLGSPQVQVLALLLSWWQQRGGRSAQCRQTRIVSRNATVYS